MSGQQRVSNESNSGSQARPADDAQSRLRDEADELAPSSSPVNKALAIAIVAAAIPAALIGAILMALLPGPWWLGLFLGVAIAAAVVTIRFLSADHRILGSLGGGLLRADGLERLQNLVQGLSLAGGVEEPSVTVLSDEARNAMVMRHRGRNHLVVTQGLLGSLGVVELEGVVAESLVRLKNGDAEAATAAAALFGRPMLDGPMRAGLQPLARFGMKGLLADDRDLEADRQAVEITRYPPGLLGAYQAMGQGELQPKANTEGLSHLWLVDPVAADAPLDRVRAPLDLRIDVLAEF